MKPLLLLARRLPEWTMEPTLTHEPSTAAEQIFDVDVCRTGFGFATIQIRASSEFEAQQAALDQAGDHLFSEKDSEYTLVHPVKEHREVVLEQSLELVLDVHCEARTSLIALRVKLEGPDLQRLGDLQKQLKCLSLSEARHLHAYESLHGEESKQRDELGLLELVHQPGSLFMCGSRSDDVEIASSVVSLPDIEAALSDGVKTLLVSNIDALDLAMSIGLDAQDGSVRLIGPYGVVEPGAPDRPQGRSSDRL